MLGILVVTVLGGLLIFGFGLASLRVAVRHDAANSSTSSKRGRTVGTSDLSPDLNRENPEAMKMAERGRATSEFLASQR